MGADSNGIMKKVSGIGLAVTALLTLTFGVWLVIEAQGKDKEPTVAKASRRARPAPSRSRFAPMRPIRPPMRPALKAGAGMKPPQSIGSSASKKISRSVRNAKSAPGRIKSVRPPRLNALRSPVTASPRYGSHRPGRLSPEELEDRRRQRRQRQIDRLKKRIDTLTDRIEQYRDEGTRPETQIRRMEQSLERMKRRLGRLNDQAQK